jgi:hypothetical protein
MHVCNVAFAIVKEAVGLAKVRNRPLLNDVILDGSPDSFLNRYRLAVAEFLKCPDVLSVFGSGMGNQPVTECGSIMEAWARGLRT